MVLGFETKADFRRRGQPGLASSESLDRIALARIDAIGAASHEGAPMASLGFVVIADKEPVPLGER